MKKQSKATPKSEKQKESAAVQSAADTQAESVQVDDAAPNQEPVQTQESAQAQEPAQVQEIAQTEETAQASEPAQPQEAVLTEESAQTQETAQAEDFAQPQETVQTAEPVFAEQNSEAQTQEVADAQSQPSAEQPAEQQAIAYTVDTAEELPAEKKKKKKDKRTTKPDKIKKDSKVRLYVISLFKYFNVITLLPFALLMYAVFFSSYIVDKGNLFNSNIKWIIVIMSIAAVIMIAWFFTNIKKRRVCSFDAFLLMALLICASMIAQCVIFKNFAAFDGIAIATLAASVVVLIMFTVRLCMFSPAVQRSHDDKSYKAKSKFTMYFKVIFTKYVFFIAMLCVIGALLILILTQSNIFEDFEFVATKTEMIVTLVFAALAAVLMVVGIFIRIVRGRANVIDCMPYMMFIVAAGGLAYFITRHTYMILYVAIGSAVVGLIWLFLCQYTLLVSNYRKVEEVVEPSPYGMGGGQSQQDSSQATADTVVEAQSDAQPVADVQPVADSPVADAQVTADTQPAQAETPATEVAADTQA